MNLKWPRVALDNLTEKDRRITYGVVKPGEEMEGGVAFVRGGDLLQGRLAIDQLRTITPQLSQVYKRTLLRGGELLISLVGNPGEVAIAPPALEGANIARQVGLIALSAQHDARFIMYFLMSPLGRAELFSRTGGAVQQVINLADLKTLKVPVPPKKEQMRIASILTAYDDLIENNRRRMALLEESARLLYREWFVRLRFPGHEHTRIVNGVPVGWKKGHIGDFVENGMVDIQTGPFGTQLKASDYTEDGTPVINVRNIGYGDLRPDKLEYVPEEITDRLSVHLLREGDIVFGRKGAVDRHILVSSSQNGWMQGSDCIRMRSLSDEVCPVLLTFAFREPSHHEWMLTQCGNKATMASLNQGVISRIPAIVPSKILQDEFRLFATDCLDQMTTLAQQNQKLRTARDLLLPKLMSGEIEV